MKVAKKILFVDDDRDFLNSQSIYFSSRGYQVLTAESGEEALKLLEKEVPDIMILDLMMEHFDSGFNVSKVIKERYPDLPVILMTAIGEETGLDFRPKSVEDNRVMHADAFLDKGASPEDLFTKICELTR